jgi:hypothetical protein
MVLVHHHGNLGVGLDRRLNQVLQKGLASVFAGACAGLHDHGGAGFFGGLHDGLDLFQVVDVEGRDAVAIGGGMVQQFAH